MILRRLNSLDRLTQSRVTIVIGKHDYIVPISRCVPWETIFYKAETLLVYGLLNFFVTPFELAVDSNQGCRCRGSYVDTESNALCACNKSDKGVAFFISARTTNAKLIVIWTVFRQHSYKPYGSSNSQICLAVSGDKLRTVFSHRFYCFLGCFFVINCIASWTSLNWMISKNLIAGL